MTHDIGIRMTAEATPAIPKRLRSSPVNMAAEAYEQALGLVDRLGTSAFDSDFYDLYHSGALIVINHRQPRVHNENGTYSSAISFTQRSTL